MRAPLVEANRHVFALARHADNAAGWRAPGRSDTRSCGAAGASSARSRRRSSWSLWLAAPPLKATLICLRTCLALRQRHEVVVGNRIFVLLTQKLALDEHVDTGWIRVGKLVLKEANERAYCSPRNTSSSSFSRWTVCFHTGMATVISTAMMDRPTMSAAMAYPAWRLCNSVSS